MADWRLRTPVAFLVYRRPDTTARVFASIREARPSVLLIVADGPNPDRPGESDAVAAARRIVHDVDWPCEVLHEYSDTNLGCKRRVSSGLDWVFSTVEEAIILEDDCLPHPTFFRFCQELLARYRDDERVMHIGGSNFVSSARRVGASYYFSRYACVWGWASWRRAWRHYDVSIRAWSAPTERERILSGFAVSPERKYWRSAFDATSAGSIDTWDYQWTFACLTQSGVAVVPGVNLISNIGFGPQATHTLDHKFRELPVEAMRFPLEHPRIMSVDAEADRLLARQAFVVPGIASRLAARARTLLRRL